MKSIFLIAAICMYPFIAGAQCDGFDNYPEGKAEAMKQHSMYRDYVKASKRLTDDVLKSKTASEEEKAEASAKIKDNTEKAFEKWQGLYEHCAGAIEWHPLDGVRFYEYFAKNETDETKQKEYQQKVLETYDGYMTCFGKTDEKKGNLLRKKANYMMYYAKSDHAETYNTYQEAVELLGNKTSYSVYKPYSYVAIALYKKQAIKAEDMRNMYESLLEIADYNIENNERYKARYEQSKAALIDAFEPILFIRDADDNQIFDCTYFVNKYTPVFYEKYSDIEYLENDILRNLKKVECGAEEPLVEKVITRIKGYQDSVRIGNRTHKDWAIIKYNAGDYEGAVEEYRLAIDEETTPESKADCAYKAGMISFAKLKNFKQARDFARKAIEIRPNWGKPYLLIGDLYASSGPLCGTGTGFESQRVTWIAIDYWNKAMKVDSDPEIAEKAKSSIRKYTQYMPDTEAIFARSLKEGQSYFIPCWIQESTTVRAYKSF